MKFPKLLKVDGAVEGKHAIQDRSSGEIQLMAYAQL